jgi:DNA invertase Pin-like site-specific DNA recombinase
MTAHRGRPRTAPEGTVVAYVRVSTDEQVSSGAGLEAQRAAIAAEAARRGWTIVGTYSDEGISGAKDVHQRPGLGYAIELIESSHASVLMVAKTDRVARGLRTLLDVIDRVERADGAVVSVDGTIDTSSAAGRFQTQIMGSVAELERALISDRTKAALAVKRAQGVRLGRPSSLSREVVERVLAARESGASLPAIARGLVADGVPTAQGGARWYPSTVRAVLHSQDAARLRAEAVTAAV